MLEIPDQFSRVVRAMNRYRENPEHLREIWDMPVSVDSRRTVEIVLLRGSREVRVLSWEGSDAELQFRLPGFRWASCPLDENQQTILNEFSALFWQHAAT